MADLADAISEEADEGGTWQRRARTAERNLRHTSQALEEAQQQLDVLLALDAYESAPPKWVAAKNRGKHEGTPVVLLSDTHFDEHVDPVEVDGANAYSREIAEQRLHRTFTSSVKVLRDHFAGLTYPGAVIMLGGDMLSGNIHEELRETNEATVLDSVQHWLDHLTAFVGNTADEFGRVHVYGVVGNHGRLTRKPRAKLRARDNLDWLLYRLLARDFRTDDRVTFTIPDSSDCRVDVCGTRFLLTHGDQFRGGTGIAGMLSPLMLGRHRKGQREASLGEPFEWLVMGHWHQYATVQGIIVNGALKGFDEYAYQSNFRPEPPCQALWVTTPEHGVTFTAPLFPGNQRREGW